MMKVTDVLLSVLHFNITKIRWLLNDESDNIIIIIIYTIAN